MAKLWSMGLRSSLQKLEKGCGKKKAELQKQSAALTLLPGYEELESGGQRRGGYAWVFRARQKNPEERGERKALLSDRGGSE